MKLLSNSTKCLIQSNVLSLNKIWTLIRKPTYLGFSKPFYPRKVSMKQPASYLVLPIRLMTLA